MSIRPIARKPSRHSTDQTSLSCNRHVKTKSRRSSNRRGVAAVELAVVAPLLVMILFGIIEFGRMIMVQQILTNASREGARRAIIEDATHVEVQQLVSDYLSNASIDNAIIAITPADLSNVGFGDPVSVTVAIPFDDVSWAGSAWFLEGTVLESATIMQGERLQ